MGAYLISPDGKKYPQNMDYFKLMSDIEEAETKELNIPECFLID